MLEFAVSIDGIEDEPGAARWVLDRDGDRLLVAHKDGTLHWHLTSECKFVLFIDPGRPRPMVVVQAEAQIVKATGLPDLDGRRQ